MSTKDTPELILVTNPERLDFHLGEATGGGPADGIELCVMEVNAWESEDGTFYPSRRIVFSRRSAEYAIKALVSYLARDEYDRANTPTEHEDEDHDP
jgi:hypothetical protein